MTNTIHDMNLEYRQRRGALFAEQRERGNEKLRTGATLAERVAGAELVVEALHERSCMAIEGHRRAAEHPGYAEYLRMLDLTRVFGWTPDVPPELNRRYGPPIVGPIAPGDSYWRPGANSTAGRRRRRAHLSLLG
jgi:hypothetical protein